VKVLKCDEHLTEQVSLQEPIDTSLVPPCHSDITVTILIGLLRWRFGMKRLTIQEFLNAKGICLSTGTISNRSLDFLLLFKEFHGSKTEDLKRLFRQQGGTILHIDGTHRSGGKVSFVLQEGLSEITVNAELIPSEAEKHVTPLLSKFKDAYDSPLVIVRDMAKGLASGASKVFPAVWQQICQIHFIRDLEKNLLTNSHKALKGSIVKHKFTKKLREFQKIPDEEKTIEELQRKWVHIAADYILHPVVKQSKWLSRPIPYHYHYERVKEIAGLTRRLILWNAANNIMYRPLLEMDTSLQRILRDSQVHSNYRQLQRTLGWLEGIRTDLRLTRMNHLKDSSTGEVDIHTVLDDIKARLSTISREGNELGGKYVAIGKRITDAFERHWEELFVPFPVVNGARIRFKRHNNGLESSHRRIRKSIRKRTGKAETNLEMEQFGDLVAIASNLWNPKYQKEIMHDVSNLADSLSQFVHELPQLRKHYRVVRANPEFPIADSKRKECLEFFVKSLEAQTQMDKIVQVCQLFTLKKEGAVC